jgi:hypothetical protein
MKLEKDMKEAKKALYPNKTPLVLRKERATLPLLLSNDMQDMRSLTHINICSSCKYHPNGV